MDIDKGVSPAARNPRFMRMLADEHAREAVRREFHKRDIRRCSGVTWSGMSPDPWPERSDARLNAEAEERYAELAAWRQSAQGRLTRAITRAQQAALQAHAAGETVRAAANRDFEAEHDACERAAAAVEREGRRLVAAARAARRALDRPHGGAIPPSGVARD